MTREEVKKNIIPMLQAYVDGDTIQVLKFMDGSPFGIKEE